MSLIQQSQPSYHNGYARSAGESAHPGLWRGLAYAGIPGMGATGLDLHDLSGYKTGGTLTSMAAAGAWVDTNKPELGRFALDYDGTADYVQLENTERMKHNGVFTCAAWVRIDATPVDYSTFFGTESGNNGLSLMVHSDSKLMMWVGDGTDFVGITDCSTALTQGVWYFVHGTHDGTNMRVHLNTLQEGSTTAQGVPTEATTAFRIGNNEPYGDVSQRFFNGSIGPLYFYDRVLNDNEIQTLYNKPLAPFRKKQTIYWKAPAAAGGTIHPNYYHRFIAGMG